MFNVKDVIWNPLLDCFVSYSGKQIHVWNKEDGTQLFKALFFQITGCHNISSMAYSLSLRMYFVASVDLNIHLFNEYLAYVGRFQLQTRSVSKIKFIESKQMIVTAGVDGCYFYDLKLVCKQKYDPNQALMLDPEGEQFLAELGPIKFFEVNVMWVKGMSILESQNIIFTWSQQNFTVHDLDGKLIFQIKGLTEYENYITDVIYFSKYNYFVTSCMRGQIYCWKFKDQRELIHEFEHHSNQVTSLQLHPGQPDLFISASNDNSIRVHCIKNFITIYTFKIDAGVNFVKMLNEKVFAAVYSKDIQIGVLPHIGVPFQISMNNMLEIKKAKTQDHDLIMSLSNDNSIECRTACRSAKLVSIIYPPPSPSVIIFMHFFREKVFIMLSSGSFCIYRLEINGILEEFYDFPMIKDSNQRSLTQKMSCISFSKTIPPMFDEEIALATQK